MIDLTPLEVRKKKGDFRRAMRGYDPALVDDFLDIVADRLEQVVRENHALTERVARLEHQVNDNRDRERALTDALVTAQEMREEMRQQTQRESELLRRTAEQEATQLRRTAETEAAQIRSDALQAREREEEVLRRLRARQQQLLQSYRTFLARELAELQVIGETLEIESMPRAASVTASAHDVRTPAPRSEPDMPDAMMPPVVDVPAPPHVHAPADRTAVVMGAIEVAPIAEDEDLFPTPLAPDELFAPALVDDEPFAPEPVEEWDAEAELSVAGTSSADDVLIEDELQFVPDDEADEREEVEEDTFELDEEIGAPDHDATILLENALRAGYRLDLEDQDGEELLLEETSNGEPPADWLDKMIDDDER